MNSNNDDMLANLLTMMMPGGIEMQEKRGQSDFVHSEVLPRDVRSGRQRGQELYERMGITIHGEADDLFFNVTLPDGWQKKPTDHSMWSTVIDASGRERMAVFYKAAFYDRSAHASLSMRYTASYEPVGGWGVPTNDDTLFVAQAKDAGKVIWTSEPMKDDKPYPQSPQNAAEEWLDQNYPEWRDPFAYWNEAQS